MRTVNVAAVALNQTPLDWEGNARRLVDGMDAARQVGADIVCLPELAITGYGAEDAFFRPGILNTAADVLFEIAPHTRGLAAVIGLPVQHGEHVYDAAAVVVDGEVAGIVAKQHLAREGLHYEPRWFRSWDAMARDVVTLVGRTLPFGDLVFDLGDVRVALEICEDAWSDDRPGARHEARGVDVILNPSASHFAFGKLDEREELVLAGARDYGVVYVYANLLGNEAGRVVYDGGGMIASPEGFVARGPRLTFAECRVTAASVDLAAFRTTKGERFGIADHGGITCAWSPSTSSIATVGARSDWETGGALREEEFTRAIALALLDYLRKSRSRGFVLSLSGGADSSAVACLIALMVRLACRELGAAGLRERLPWLPDTEDESALVGAILTCVYQRTENNSEETRMSAATLAGALGARYLEIDVDAIVDTYVALVGDALGRVPTWEEDDVALQNIQARVRGPSVWMIANLTGALLVSTSNRSEAAVGYATMDGDTCGGISPIAGIGKSFLLQWLRWLERAGPEGAGPIPALDVVNELTPSAELRPREKSQRDEDDLMPYPILDAIEEAAIGRRKDPLTIWRDLCAAHPDLPRDQLRAWVDRFFTLWCRNQWKRERYAPAFHVDDRNLDPKTWCRFPILSGGFVRERRRMEEAE